MAKNGRPSVNESRSIKKRCNDYFLNGMSAEFTAKKLKCNINTVRKYFKEFDKELEILEGKEFEQNAKRNRSRNVILLDSQIDELLELQSELKSELKKLKPTQKSTRLYEFLINKQIQIAKEISNLSIKREDVANRLTQGAILEQGFEELISHQ